ncbi:MAG TPA: SGNH/GDSL hydrolase family protein [Steroidobacteraceae bacterium]|nr:SGNH/GDSL hydrolase family protein [Steroidobacteraceae bacterium]
MVRIVTGGIALGLVLLAVIDRPVLQGGALLGWAQSGLLAAAVCLGALCFAPLSWNQNALTVLTSVGISLVIAEFVLRATLGPQFDTIYERDDRVLYRLVPGAERIKMLPPVNGGAVVRYKINSQGFRGPELARPGESTRVLVYGDSFIHGEFSRTEDTFTEQLRGRLARKMGKTVEVVNAGVEGYGPDQELRRMEDELPALKPNLVIVAIYAGNDFGDLLRDKLYRLSSDGSLQDNPSMSFDESAMKRSRSEPILRKIMRAALIRLFATAVVSHSRPDLRNYSEADRWSFTGREARRARMDAFVKQGIDQYREYIIEGDNAVHSLADPYNADVSLIPTSESARYKIAMMEQIMRRMVDTAAKNNAALVFLLIPSLLDAADQHEFAEVDPVKYPEYKRSTLTDILEQICQRHGFHAVNLFGPFWERRADDLYLTGDGHWDPRGQAYAAELVSEFVSAQNLLGGPSPDTGMDQRVSGHQQRESGQ